MLLSDRNNADPSIVQTSGVQYGCAVRSSERGQWSLVLETSHTVVDEDLESSDNLGSGVLNLSVLDIL